MINDKKAYEKMCADLEKARIYDGRGTEDVYECSNPQCNHIVYSTYIDKGVTPFCIVCDKCNNFMGHTNTFPTIMIPVNIEWYRPTFEEYQKLSEAEKEHVINGGLLKRKKQNNYV